MARIAAGLLGCCAAVAGAAETVWLDFETRGTAADWNAPQGGLEFGIAPVPADGAAPGHALRLHGPAKGFLYTRKTVLPEILTNECALTFRVRPADAAPLPAEFEVQFIEPDGVSKFWRKVTVATQGWTRVELPLRFFRTGGVRLPRWTSVRHFAFLLRGAADLWVDDVAFVREPDLGVEIGLKELRAIAFPEAAEGAVRAVRSAEFAVLTDCADLDLKDLAAALGGLTADLRRQLPSLPPPERPPVLAVFANEADYRAFPGRIAERLGSEASPPTSDGYTVVGVATSFWDPAKGTRRPVYFHEFVHAWLAQAGGLVCAGGWLHEGVANHFQIAMVPQDGLAASIAKAIASGAAKPFGELCTDRPVRVADYWQLMTLFRMFLEREPYATRLPGLFTAVRDANTFDLGRHLQPVFGVDEARLTADWRAFCAGAYGAPAATPP
ncbi:MAG: hypothetical protein FJ221_06605 [Lentisphaerae bacterium]|nr:hypothetical protein [Lentisphaerota bacterium]